jgi:hypothetical protein
VRAPKGALVISAPSPNSFLPVPTPPARPVKQTDFGYSGTPLISKLGIKAGARIAFVSPPPEFSTLLGQLPDAAAIVGRGEIDFSVLFASNRADLVRGFAKLRDRLASAGMLWVAWPKKSSGVKTDLTEDVVRNYGLDCGLVDVKVCAIDSVWSGLKFVRRLKDR